ncbi:MAG: glucuronate isomerase [Runella slithyformis]|nr:MAG: glucuronate isomerase [Runella slithyformis]TAE99209.1 MAG: glucuronate isomerase [Runella slithyformis]TAF24390.1 MAG: glucuronate isomerase [Runella slithyformis]TAF49323.1 MAG: glucuronate isomerase [Runella slithyformis]TAF79183.1 MAG: glucuronate isomerase [Runella slithyformis]
MNYLHQDLKTFITEEFLLKSETAKRLYYDFAQQMPIIDYHNHLIPKQIADDTVFENLTQVWLYGDHYKWRAMRTNGIDERYCTGDASDQEKFQKYAETVPYTMRNPIYHWTHLELLRYFDVDILLNKDTAAEIYEECSTKLKRPDFSTQNLLRKMKVELVGTTDDPTDSLQYHQQLGNKPSFGGLMLPTFRPDKAMAVENTPDFLAYVQKLTAVSGVQIAHFDDFLAALASRYAHFVSLGCKASDHGLEQIYAEDCTETEAKIIFKKVLDLQAITPLEILKFKSAMLLWFGQQNHAHGLVQQFHLGALRNNNQRLLAALGPDTGFDSIGDFSQARSLSKYLNKLDSTNQLAKTILYNLNPADNEMMAAMIGNFQDGTVAGKIQFGSGWWFLDQKDGMERQINALSNMGLLSQFVGMLTDSRSFLSYPRHEYFRRILCNLIGQDVENQELPNDLPWLGKMVQDICYYNAKAYFEL